jgi:hypothetical protein
MNPSAGPMTLAARSAIPHYIAFLRTRLIYGTTSFQWLFVLCD